MSKDNKPQQIFHAALALDAGQRAEYLDVACRQSPQLRQMVDSLLVANVEADQFMEGEMTCDQEARTAELNQQIGRYKLLEKIGEGGFGVVYMAQQLEPIERRVALKVIKAGMDTKQVIARFEAERQALALMDHPHIAKILDAGETETGRPYFVMELVRGVPVTEYCDQRGLSTQHRLEIFSQVCSAVQHAHQKGIIHRDIKPSNILVATNGDKAVPMVIDFGIAKATQGRLTDKTLFTNFRQFVGTPAYMSPEQAQMSAVDVDTRSDIYSLGVLLYELLTGRTPLDTSELLRAGHEELCRRIREEVAMKPSKRVSSLQQHELITLAKHRGLAASQFESSVSGDLDWIVMKAVEKDRSRRYDSCGAFASDIERYLKNEPVSAGPPSTTYHLRKWFERNRTAALTAVSFLLLLLLCTVVATTGWLRAIDVQGDLTEQFAVTTAETQRAVGAEQAAKKALSDAESERRQTLATLYLTDMQLAHQAYQANNLGLAQRILKQNRNIDAGHDPRHWEWGALWQRCRGNAEKILGVEGKSVSSLSVCREGKWLAAGGVGAARVWDVSTGKLRSTLFEDGRRAGNSIFAADGQKLYVECGDQTIRSWSVPEFSQTDDMFSHACPNIISMAVSPNGKWLAALGKTDPSEVDGLVGVMVWNLQTRELAKEFSQLQGGSTGTVTVSADSKLLVIGLFDRLRAVDLQSFEDVRVIEPLSARAAVAISPDKTIVASATGLSSPRIQVHRVDDAENITTIKGHSDGIRALAFTPDGNLLASASADQTVRLWDAKTFEEVARYRGHLNQVQCLTFSADGNTLYSGGRDGRLCAWNVESRGRVSAWPIVAQQATRWGDWYRQHSQISFSPDGKILVSTRSQEDETRRLGVTLRSPVNLKIEQTLLETGFERTGVRFSPVENLFVVGDVNGSLAFVDLATPNEEDQIRVLAGSEIFPSRFTPNGNRLLVIARGETETNCVVYSVEDRHEISRWKLIAHEACASISPDGALVAIGGDSGIRFWSLHDTSEPVRTIPIDWTRGLDFSPDGRLLAAGTRNGLIEMIDVESGKVIRKLAGHTQHIGAVRFSPDGKRLASAGNKHDAMKVWDVETGRELVNFKSEIGWGYSHRQVEWSPDGNSILLMGGEADVTIWRVPSIQEMEVEGSGG